MLENIIAGKLFRNASEKAVNALIELGNISQEIVDHIGKEFDIGSVYIFTSHKNNHK